MANTLARYSGLFMLTVFCSPALSENQNGPSIHEIRYPIPDGSPIYEYQDQYFTATLKLALEKSQYPYKLMFIKVPSLQQSRSMKLIEQNVYDIHWMATSNEREENVQPIRIPLFKGLLGLRIGFVRAGQRNLFQNLDSVDQLAEFVVGQGKDWTDTDILNYHHFNLLEAISTEALFEMLKLGRIDYFPRSVLELYAEYSLYDDRALAIEPHIALHYPTAVYFFVRKGNDSLHEAVESGLKMAIADGSFEQLFDQYFSQSLKQADLPGRRIFDLANPYLPEQTPLENKRLWYQLERR